MIHYSIFWPYSDLAVPRIFCHILMLKSHILSCICWQLKVAQTIMHINLTICYYDIMFRFREIGTYTENTVSLSACSSFPADGLFSVRWRCFLEVMREVNTAYFMKVFITLTYIMRERTELFLQYEVLSSLLWWGMGCLVWNPECWGKCQV